ALPWFAESFRLQRGAPAREAAHRLRLVGRPRIAPPACQPERLATRLTGGTIGVVTPGSRPAGYRPTSGCPRSPTKRPCPTLEPDFLDDPLVLQRRVCHERLLATHTQPRDRP